MRVRVRYIFPDSTFETTLDEKPNIGDIVNLPTNQGNIRLQVERITSLNRPEGIIYELRFFDAPKITFLPQPAPFELFSAYPEIRELGRDRLQAICDEWIITPVARETGVIEVGITKELAFTFRAGIGSAPKADEVYHFPADDLLRFIAENSVAPKEKNALLARIVAIRRKLGVEFCQRFLLTSPDNLLAK